jgi:hypothetical protein
VSRGLLTGSWPSLSASPNEGVQATASSLRFAMLRCGFQPLLRPGVRSPIRKLKGDSSQHCRREVSYDDHSADSGHM